MEDQLNFLDMTEVIVNQAAGNGDSDQEAAVYGRQAHHGNDLITSLKVINACCNTSFRSPITRSKRSEKYWLEYQVDMTTAELEGCRMQSESEHHTHFYDLNISFWIQCECAESVSDDLITSS